MNRIKKDWGYEEWICNTELYCFKKIFVKKGFQCSIHWHKEKDETFYIESGRIILELFGISAFELRQGQDIRLLPNTLHRFTAVEDTMIYEISTHHEDSDSYRVIKGGKVERSN